MLRKKISFFCVFILLFGTPYLKAIAQLQSLHYENHFQMPLEDVLRAMEQRYVVKIKRGQELVQDQTVDFAPWKFRADLKATEVNLLWPNGLKLQDDGNGVYKLKRYEYHRWQPQEGWDFLALLAGRYHDVSSWELRRDSLRAELNMLLQIERLRGIPIAPIVVGNVRQYTDYTVQNFALEIIPGVTVNGSIYRPKTSKAKFPLMLSPDGHWGGHRYREDAQKRFITLARLGAIAVSYDLFGWGESLLQFKSEDHRSSIAMLMQTWAGVRIMDYFYEQPDVDRDRVGISGGSGGGSHTNLMAALDGRFTLAAPVVSMSSYFFGGCPCESGLPIHFVGGGTNNVELAAFVAPHPQLIISDGRDWTSDADKYDVPYLDRMYSFYHKKNHIEHVHLPEEGHDFGINKRMPLYRFVIKHFDLPKGDDLDATVREEGVRVEKQELLLMYGVDGALLPASAIKGLDELKERLRTYQVQF